MEIRVILGRYGKVRFGFVWMLFVGNGWLVYLMNVLIK